MDKKIQLEKRSRGWAALLDGSTETPLNFQKVVELLEPDALGVHLLKISFVVLRGNEAIPLCKVLSE